MSSLRSTFADTAAALREAARTFIGLFAAEGRIASLRALRIIVFAISASLLIAMGWLFLLMAVAFALVDNYGWKWPYVLCLFSALHIAAAVTLLLVTRKTAATHFFPTSLRHVAQESGLPAGTAPLRLDDLNGELHARESEFTHAKQTLAANIVRSRKIVARSLIKPAIVICIAGAGMLIGLRKPPARRVFAAPSTVSRITGLLSSPMIGLVMSTVAGLMENRARRAEKNRVRPER